MSKSILIHEMADRRRCSWPMSSRRPVPARSDQARHRPQLHRRLYRSGLYATPLPNAVGREAAGVITAVGPKVKVSRRATASLLRRARRYCRSADGRRPLVHVPKGVSRQQAAAIC